MKIEKLQKLFLAMLLTAFFASSAIAQPAKRHPELDKFEEHGGTVEFVGHSYGLDAYRLSKEGDVSYAYTTPEGGLVMGVMVNPTGGYETVSQIKDHNDKTETAKDSAGKEAVATSPDKPKAELSKVESLYADIEKAAWIKSGKDDAPYIYLFVNANCDHCQGFWNDLSNAMKTGLVQVRLVPFGKVEANRDGGAALLSVADPAQAWKDYMGGNVAALGKDKIKEGAYDKIDANTALVNKWQIKGPPFAIYRKPATGALVALVGRPQNPMVVLADLMK